MQRKKILWLPSWYPNKYDPFDGDFIQRHAKAVALQHDVHVLFIKQSERQATTERTINEEAGLIEELIYLPKKNSLLAKPVNLRRWWRQYQIEVRRLVQAEKPEFIHVHVPWRTSLVALWAKQKFAIPFLITEHWGIYNRVADDNIYTKPIWFRLLVKRIFYEASGFSTVSHFLGEGVSKAVVPLGYDVIPNVVDTSLFYHGSSKLARFTFLHVSNMVPLKNVSGLLLAFQEFLLATGADAQLVLIGNRDDLFVETAESLGLLNRSVFFRGEVPYATVAEEMRQSHVFVLNSNIENSPCVIGEALCCGLPVVATNVGGIPELLTSEDGILVSPNNTSALAEALIQIFKTFHTYNSRSIAQRSAAKFSPSTVATAFSSHYAHSSRRNEI